MGLEKITEFRKKKGLSLEELSAMSGVPIGTLSKISAGITKNPNLDTVKAIAHALGCTIDDFDKSSQKLLSDEEEQVLNVYRKLSFAGKKHFVSLGTDLIAYEKEYGKFIEKQLSTTNALGSPNDVSENTSDNVIFIDTYTQSASAGTGQYLDDDSFQRLGYPADRVPVNTDFAVPVAGDSMEPEYSDGDIVFVERSEDVAFGDIGLFVLNGEGFIKICDPKGLISLNPAYSPIKINDDCSFKTIGKILGKL